MVLDFLGSNQSGSQIGWIFFGFFRWSLGPNSLCRHMLRYQWCLNLLKRIVVMKSWNMQMLQVDGQQVLTVLSWVCSCPIFAKIAIALVWTCLSLVTICVPPFDCFRLIIYRDSFLWLLDIFICKCCLSCYVHKDTCVLLLPCELVLTVRGTHGFLNN